jgi:hypothetical protein
LKDYGLAALTGAWLADGIPRIMAPPLLHRTGLRIGHSNPRRDCGETSRDHRRHFLALHFLETARLPALEGDDGWHDRKRAFLLIKSSVRK